MDRLNAFLKDKKVHSSVIEERRKSSINEVISLYYLREMSQEMTTTTKEVQLIQEREI